MAFINLSKAILEVIIITMQEDSKKNEQIFSKSDYGKGVVCFIIETEDLSCEDAAYIFESIKSAIHKKAIKELIIDVNKLKNADPLALSLLPASKNICAEKKKEFFVSGLSPELHEEMIKHSSFKGKYLPAKESKFISVHDQIEHIGDISIDIGKNFLAVVEYSGEFAAEIWKALTRPRKIRWRETLYYMDMCGADALPIVTVICFLMGLILGFQGAIQLHKLGTDTFLADFVGLVIVKELGPLMVAMISTGRAGSAFAAEIGTMKVGEEVNALTTFGFIPSRFLFIPKLIAMLLVLPLLTVFGDFVGILGGMTVGYFKLGLPIISYYNRTLQVIDPIHLTESLVKSLVFAFLITVVGCIRGFESDDDAQGVGRSATSAVVTSIFMIVLADTGLTILFSMIAPV